MISEIILTAAHVLVQHLHMVSKEPVLLSYQGYNFWINTTSINLTITSPYTYHMHKNGTFHFHDVPKVFLLFFVIAYTNSNKVFKTDFFLTSKSLHNRVCSKIISSETLIFFLMKTYFLNIHKFRIKCIYCTLHLFS